MAKKQIKTTQVKKENFDASGFADWLNQVGEELRGQKWRDGDINALDSDKQKEAFKKNQKPAVYVRTL